MTNVATRRQQIFYRSTSKQRRVPFWLFYQIGPVQGLILCPVNTTMFVCFNSDYGDTFRRSGESCLSNMARIRKVGRCAVRHVKAEKPVQFVEQIAYDEAVIEEVDPNIDLVAKLQKGLKLFRDVTGDSDGEVTSVCFVNDFARCDQDTDIINQLCWQMQNANALHCKIIPF